MIALAFEHNFAIAKNVPLVQVVDWLVSIAPDSIIEFVQRRQQSEDVGALREDIFQGYTVEAFKTALESVARSVRSEKVSASCRELFRVERN